MILEAQSTVYLAGPMRGYEDYNFPAFDKYQKYLEYLGYRVISPANLDRDAGLDPKTFSPTPESIREVIRRDCLAIIDECDEMFLMPNWQHSKGVAVEKALAEFLGLPVHELPLI